MKNVLLFLFITVTCLYKINAQPLLETGRKKMPNVWIDNTTHHKVIKLCTLKGINGSFYFHNNPFISSINNEGDRMLFYNTKGSTTNAYTVNLNTLATEQITFSKKKIYSEIIGHKYNNLYYQIGDSIFVTNIDTKITKLLFIFPDNYKASIATVNADETFLAGVKVSDVQKEILKIYPEKKDYFHRIFNAHLPNDLFVINLKTGKLKTIYTENTWLGHIQFSPTNPELLMFCHEGPWHQVDRIWNIDINTGIAKLIHKRTMDLEIAGHEWFAPDGKMIWYDLQQPRSMNFFVGGTNVQTGEEMKYKITRDEWSIHFNISNDMKYFCGDGGNDTQVAKAKDGMWIYYFVPQGDSLHAERLVNMKHHQYHLEPNVHFSPDGKWVIFRANFEGEENVYAVEIKKLL